MKLSGSCGFFEGLYVFRKYRNEEDAKQLKQERSSMRKKIKAIPEGYRTVTPYLSVKGAAALLGFVQQAFGANVVERMDRPDGGLVHAAVKIGDSMVMMGEVMENCDPMPASIFIYVEDTDKVYQQALKAGASSVMAPSVQFWGDRLGVVKDACGNQWSIATHVEDVLPEEMKKRGEEWMRKQKS